MRERLKALYPLALPIAVFKTEALAFIGPFALIIEWDNTKKFNCIHRTLIALALAEVSLKIYILVCLESFSVMELCREVAVPITYISFLMVEISKETRRLLAKASYIIFTCDLMVNLYTVINGFDIIGRIVPQREHDYFPRLIGLLGHPFQSINITIIAFISAVSSNRLVLYMMPIVPLLLTSSQRAPVIAGFLICSYLILKRRRLWSVYILFPYAFAIVVVALVFVVAQNETASLGHFTSNQLRVECWQNALRMLPRGIFWGVRNLSDNNFDPNLRYPNYISLFSSGNAESYLLQSFVKFGCLVFLAKAAFYLLVFLRLASSYHKKQNDGLLGSVILASLVASESIFGTSVASSVYISIYYGAYCLSSRYLV